MPPSTAACGSSPQVHNYTIMMKDLPPSNAVVVNMKLLIAGPVLNSKTPLSTPSLAKKINNVKSSPAEKPNLISQQSLVALIMTAYLLHSIIAATSRRFLREG